MRDGPHLHRAKIQSLNEDSADRVLAHLNRGDLGELAKVPNTTIQSWVRRQNIPGPCRRPYEDDDEGNAAFRSQFNDWRTTYNLENCVGSSDQLAFVAQFLQDHDRRPGPVTDLRLGFTPFPKYPKALPALFYAFGKDRSLRSLSLSQTQVSDLSWLPGLLRGNTTLTYLDLSSNVLGEEAKYIAPALRGNATLRTLLLSGSRDVDREECIADGEDIAAAVASSGLTHLDLAFNDFSVEAARVLISSVPSLRRLDLRGNYFLSRDTDTAGEMADLVLANRRLEVFSRIPIRELQEQVCTELMLAHQHLGVIEAIVISHLAKDNTALKRLDLRSNQIEWDGALALADALRGDNALTDLLIGECTEEGMAEIINAARERDRLRFLSLASSLGSIGGEGAEDEDERPMLSYATLMSLAGYVASSTSLQHLDLKSIYIEEDEDLWTALRQNRSLTSLNLSDCNFIDDGYLMEILDGDMPLTTLNLSHNDLQPVLGTRILQAVSRKNVMTDLDLSDTLLTSLGLYGEVAPSLIANTSLTALNLSDNALWWLPSSAELDLSDNELWWLTSSAELETIIRENSHLTTLKLANTGIDDSRALELLEALDKNTTLMHLDMSKNYHIDVVALLEVAPSNLSRVSIPSYTELHSRSSQK
jgi:Ran GTPase-activating protein (RanGAP) involved in mRNA processing and transport